MLFFPLCITVIYLGDGFWKLKNVVVDISVSYLFSPPPSGDVRLIEEMLPIFLVISSYHVCFTYPLFIFSFLIPHP